MDEKPYEIRKWANHCIFCIPALQQSFCLESFLTNLSLFPAADLLEGICFLSKILIPQKIFPFI